VLELSLDGTGRAGEIAAASPRELVAALRPGNSVMLVIANRAAARPTDEAYGDWADALNNFAAHADPRLKIVKLTAHAYRLAIAAPRIPGQFATLFVRDRDHALLYQGMILEREVYHLGQDYILEQTEPPQATAYGLTPTTIRLRRGKIGAMQIDAPAARTCAAAGSNSSTDTRTAQSTKWILPCFAPPGGWGGGSRRECRRPLFSHRALGTRRPPQQAAPVADRRLCPALAPPRARWQGTALLPAAASQLKPDGHAGRIAGRVIDAAGRPID
jgi:hypothetical protein